MSSFEDKTREKLNLDTLIEWYKREILSDDYTPANKAVILYQLGRLEELFNKDPGEATRYYLLAYKQDQTFALPIIAAGSTLFSTKSFERLLRLYETTVETITDVPLKSAIIMFIIEALTAQGQRESLDGYLQQLETLGRYPVHSLVFQEWNRLRSRNEEEAFKVLERWKVASEHPYVRSDLCLELARIHETKGNRQLALELLREAAHNGRDFFPTMPELIGMGIRSGEAGWLEEVVMDDIAALLQGGDPLSRFILARPAGGEEAAAILAGFLLSLAARPGVSLSDAGRQKLHEIVLSTARGGKAPCSFSMLMESAKGSSKAGAQAEALQLCLQQPVEPLERAWLVWNMVKIRLQSGETKGAIESIKVIKGLGFSSRILDSLMLLFHFNLGQQDEMLSFMDSVAAEKPGDLVADAILADLKWSYRGDFGSVAKTLSSYEKYAYGMEDLAYIAAVKTGDASLKEKALRCKVAAPGTENLMAKVDLIRLHAFEKLSTERLLGIMDDFSPSSRAIAVWASLIGLWKTAEGGQKERQGAFLKNIAGNVSASSFFPYMLSQWASRLLGLSVLEEESGEIGEIPESNAVRTAIGYHTILQGASNPAAAAGTAKWTAEKLRSDDHRPLSPVFLALLAGTLLRGCRDEALAAELSEALSSSPAIAEKFPDLPMVLTLKERNLEKILKILREVNDLFDMKEYDREHQIPLNIMSALHSLFIEKDFSKTAAFLERNRSGGRIDRESMFMLLFALPLSGRWKEWSQLWSDWTSAHTDEAGGRYERDMERAAMLARLCLEGDLEGAGRSADAILSAVKGDPASTIVKLYGAFRAGEAKDFSQFLHGLRVWMGEAALRGKISYHLGILDLLQGKMPGAEDETLVVPDVFNMDYDTALVLEEGLINLTDPVVDSTLAGLKAVKEKAWKIAGLTEFGEFLESATRPLQALEAYVEALKTDPASPGAILGIIRNAKPLKDYALLGWAYDLYAEITADAKKSAARFSEAAENYRNAGGKDDEVLRCYQRAFELDPSNDKSFHGLLGALEKAGDAGRLISFIERRVGTISEYGELQMLLLKLADLKRQIKDLDGALVAVEDLLLITPETAPEKITALRLKMDLFIQVGKIDKAFEVGSQIVAEAQDQKVRRGILKTCINLAFQKLNSPEKGLEFCLRLIEEGETDAEFVNKTLRIALKLARWDDAASIQDMLARESKTEKEKTDNLLKKAEIYLRYAKNQSKAEEEYRRILRANPVRWEALTRWQAARGANHLKQEEIMEFVDAAYGMLQNDPLQTGAINLIIRANRILLNTPSARYYESILDLLSGSEAKKIPTPPGMRTSIPLGGLAPTGALDPDDLESLSEPDRKVKFINDLVRVMGRREIISVLKQEGIVPKAADVDLENGASPILKYVQAWGRVFGLDQLQVFRSPAPGEFIDAHPNIPYGIVAGAQVVIPLPPVATFSLGFNLYNIAQGLQLLSLVDGKKLTGLVASAIRLCSRGASEIEKEESFTDVLFVGLNEAMKASVTEVLDRAGSLTREDVNRWHRTMYVGALRAGHLVSGKIEALFNFLYPGFAKVEETPPDVIADMVGRDDRLKDVLRFALSRRYEIMRQVAGLEL